MRSHTLTQYCKKYIKRAILANLQHRPLNFGRLIILMETRTALENSVPMATHSFPVPTQSIWLVSLGRKTFNEAANSSRYI